MGISEDDRAEATEVFMLPRGHDYAEGFDKSEDEIEFDKFKDEFRQSNEYAKVSVYRQPTTSDGRPGQKQLTFLFEAGVDEYNFSQLASRVRDEYGSGVYRVQLRDAENKMRMNRAISIEAPKTSADNSGRDSVPHIIAELRRSQEANQRQMAEFIRGPNASIDPVEQMVKMATALGGMMTALMPQQQPIQPQQTVGAQIKEFLLIKELMDGLSGGGAAGGEANFFTLMTETVKNFGPLLMGALAAGQKDGTVDAAGIIQAPQPRLENPIKETQKMTPDEKLIAAHKNSVDFLVFQAKGNAEPAAVAKFAIDKVPDDDLAPLELFLKREDCVALCERANPEVKNYTEWFVAWRGAMILELENILTDDAEPEHTAEVAGVDDPDPHDAGADQEITSEDNADNGTDESDTPSNT